VRVVELHHSEPRPAAVGSRARVALNGDDFVTPTSQSGTHDQPSGPQSDDGYSHADHQFGILAMC
jgi:hypothetical protein